MNQALFPVEEAKSIVLLLLDVDGVLTDGKIILGNRGEEFKAFHVHDGQGIHTLQKNGIKVGLITQRHSPIVDKRAAELKIQYVYQNIFNKLEPFKEMMNVLKCGADQIAYMGDDIPDLPVLKQVGLSATVANAPLIIKNQVKWVSQFNGGNGAVRELCDHLMKAKGFHDFA